MSISAISGVSSSYPANDVQNDPRTLFRQLTQAINAGNLTSAQQAFSSLTQLAGQNGLANSPLGGDVTALGQALQSGNITSAQQALGNLQTDAEKLRMGHHHHHHHASPASSSSASTSSADGTTPVSGTNLNVTA